MKESKRVFSGPAFKILSHSANLHRTDIRSDLKPKKVVKAGSEIIEIDIDEVYYNKVKTIYNQIIEYATKITTLFSLSVKTSKEVTQIRMANRHVISAIKDAKFLQKNIDAYAQSSNKSIVRQYNKLRKKLARVLSLISEIQESDNAENYAMKVDNELKRTGKSDFLFDGTVDKLIRENEITAEMASSLANDSYYVNEICKNSLIAAQLLYIKTDKHLEELAQE